MSTVRRSNKTSAYVVLAAAGLGALALAGFACERDQRALGVDRDREPSAAPPPARPEKHQGQTGDRDKGPAGGQEKGTMGDKGEEAPQATGAFASAIDSIAKARCDREAKCDSVGPDKKYKSHDACLTEIRKDKVEGLNAKDCPGGVDRGELQDCLEEIRQEDCKNPLDSIARIKDCRASELCKAAGAPPR